ncbi:MAG: polyribonucleotide nucleotidyltransferase [SAR202 cluster bacterium]|nr:polyribonucleotide nucleotidyltransferase [SAR202 cluster bacterium]
MASSFQTVIGGKTLSFESGKLAQKANGSVLVRYGDSVVLVTATMAAPRVGVDFFPLTVDFEERLYARGKIPGSFFRREGRPSTDAILTDRLTDRPLRPLFPKGFRNEVQIISTALSADMENPLDIPSIIGASTALSISDIPFEGPLGATRIGYVNGEFIVNPTYQQIEESQLDLVVAGTKDGVAMIEAGASELSEDRVFEAIQRAQEVNLTLIEFQNELVRAMGKPKASYVPAALPDGLEAKVAELAAGRIPAAVRAATGSPGDKSQLESLEAEVVAKLGESHDSGQVAEALESLVNQEFRRRILEEGARPDGRHIRQLRPISCEVGLLPRTHGTGLFSRGETQALGVITLGSVGDAQKLDTLHPRDSKRFMLHYNFPPYSTGEAKRVGSPGRREIGHGALAERALLPVIPDESQFPYTIRVVSEILSSNGSTSMASVCASTLALLDASVPIKAPVAGISIGLITGNDGKFVTLTDIQGKEDHIGDMDFKVAGTSKGITAIQLDIKVKHISFAVVRAALDQAHETRLAILDKMRDAIPEPRKEMSKYAPRMFRITIPVEKIGMVIGPGGKMIRSIIEQTKATVDIEDDGTVYVGSPDSEAAQKALDIIENMTKGAKVGEIYTGRVVKILDFGAFVEILPGTDGMVHISELANHRVAKVEDVVSVGDEITVKVKDIDSNGRISLSRRALLEADGGGEDDGDRQPPLPSEGDEGQEERAFAGPPRPAFRGPGAPPRSGGPPHRGGPPRGGPRGGPGGPRPGGFGPRRPGGGPGGPPRNRPGPGYRP